jgi:uncharacterized protein YqgC (DUF456 family)
VDWVLILSLILMAIGLIGVVLPVVPGIVLILAAALFYALVEGFEKLGLVTVVVLTVLGVVGVTADIWVSSLGARAGGASFLSILGGLFLGLAGLLFFSLPGAIIGSILGVLAVEMLRVKDWRRGLNAGVGWLVGWLISTVIQLTIALIMIAIFVWQVGLI